MKPKFSNSTYLTRKELKIKSIKVFTCFEKTTQKIKTKMKNDMGKILDITSQRSFFGDLVNRFRDESKLTSFTKRFTLKLNIPNLSKMS